MTSKQLKKIRMDQGLTQKQAAEVLEITQGRMSQLESGWYSDRIPLHIEEKVISLWNPPPEDYYVPLPVPAPKDAGYIEDDLERDSHGEPLSCYGCRHRSRNGDYNICNYIHDTGVPRGCLIKNCRHYEKGPRPQNSRDWVKGYHIG